MAGRPESPAAPAVSHAPALTLAQQIAKLPPLTGTGIDPAAQGKRVLAHLNAILRFYATAISPVQKIGEPSDVIYADQARAQATQVAQLAFQSALNEAELMARIPGNGTAAASAADAGSQGAQLSAARTRFTAQIAALEVQEASLDTQLLHATAKTRPALEQQREQVDGGLELQRATLDAITRISTFSATQSQTGLAGDIERLRNSAPELAATVGAAFKPLPSPSLANLSDARSAGVMSQAFALFQLIATRHTIDTQVAAVDDLLASANELRTPFRTILRSTVQKGEQMTQQSVDLASTPTTDAEDLLATRKQFDDLTTQFRVLADSMLPLSQEVVLLEAERGTLTSWRIAVDSEYRVLLRSLLVRVAAIAIALGVLWLLSTLWSRATVRYVSDLRRRRQLLLIRRMVVAFVGGLVVIFGFVTQFSSLATFAGFITAGIAVGLQTILLSVAAYFFIIGRYGVRVGDRITVAGVTGDVIEVGLVRFYLTELVGTGTAMHSTGRVAMFANSVLFQSGTPLYKQMPGTEYAWHELTAKLNADADADAVKTQLVAIVDAAYGSSRARIEAQHKQVEQWLGAALDKPCISSHLQLVDGALMVRVLFPVEIAAASETDQQIATALIPAMAQDGVLKQGLATMPAINAAIKS